MCLTAVCDGPSDSLQTNVLSLAKTQRDQLHTAVQTPEKKEKKKEIREANREKVNTIDALSLKIYG